MWRACHVWALAWTLHRALSRPGHEKALEQLNKYAGFWRQTPIGDGVSSATTYPVRPADRLTERLSSSIRLRPCDERLHYCRLGYCCPDLCLNPYLDPNLDPYQDPGGHMGGRR